MRTERVIRALLWLAAITQFGGAAAYASDPLPPAANSPVSQSAQAAQQVTTAESPQDWRLDTAIFTDILPVNAPEIAIKLPADQRDERQ